MHLFKQSNAWLERSKSIIPGGSSTNAKNYDRLFPGVTPVTCAKSNGAYFTDLDDNVWLDFEMAMGCAIWGHRHPVINQAIMTQLSKGSSFTLPSELEVQLAVKLLERVGAFEMVRFSKNGADVVSASIRIARAFTGRTKVFSGTYHGWHDWYLGSNWNNGDDLSDHLLS
ncbi:MAG: aminotransferase class III-fold pyridoxal phosphate-dependent enzyme, partial [Saprospiraceae bacterium]|nr:aminotransferase class III-fold pyridoxal phosphate-dependent enzyme [Saprospiraceae bacterium]